MEKKWTPENNFSLHDWTIKSMLYDNYLFEKDNGQALFEQRKRLKREAANKKTSNNKSCKRKRKPRKVNLESMSYV